MASALGWRVWHALFVPEATVLIYKRPPWKMPIISTQESLSPNFSQLCYMYSASPVEVALGLLFWAHVYKKSTQTDQGVCPADVATSFGWESPPNPLEEWFQCVLSSILVWSREGTPNPCVTCCTWSSSLFQFQYQSEGNSKTAFLHVDNQ